MPSPAPKIERERGLPGGVDGRQSIGPWEWE
jgi:hypothetical protein